MADQKQLLNSAIDAPKAINAKKAITAEQATQAVQATRAINLDELKRLRNQNKQVDTFLSNYNDPTELNSFIDALTNREAVSKKFGDTWGTISTLSGTVSTLAWLGAAVAAVIPGGQPVAAGLAATAAATAAPAIPAAVDVLYEKGLKPIAAGKPQEAGLNMLMNLGETMDFAANPVKGFILEGPEGFAKATGLASGGRVNYDFDTGNFLTDMLLEVVSDPMNWIDLGTGAALKAGAKTLGRESAVTTSVNSLVDVVNKKFAGELGEIAAEGTARITKKVTNTTVQVAREFAEATADNFTSRAKKLVKRAGQQWDFLSQTEKNRIRRLAKNQLQRESQTQIQQTIVQAIKTELPKASDEQINILLRKAGVNAHKAQSAKTMYDLISENITYDKLSSDIVSRMAHAQHYSSQAQKFFTKGAMLTSGYGLGVEAAKYGWQGIHKWANNLTLQKLKKATVFDDKRGLDIKQWQKAKGIWEATYRYTTDLAGNVSQRDINAFYAFANEQMNRDRQFISLIMQSNSKPTTLAAQLDAKLQELYNCNFKEYIEIIKNISASENDLFANHIAYLDSVYNLLNSKAFIEHAEGITTKTGDKLFQASQIEVTRIIQDLQKAIKEKNGAIDLTEQLYAIKLNNAYVTAELIKNPQVATIMQRIASSEDIGALFNNLAAFAKDAPETVSALIEPTINRVRMASKSFVNIKNFINTIAQTPFPKIKGISADNFKQYIIDQILNGRTKPAKDLLAGFDISMASFMNGLETMLYDKGFKFKDYPVLEDQIAKIYRQFLETQVNDGVELLNIGASDFVKDIDFLINNFVNEYPALQELAIASELITAQLKEFKLKNLDLLDAVFTDKNTIFQIANTRELSDVGLALETISTKENLAMFDIPADISGNAFLEINNIGKAIRHTKDRLTQYNVCFKDSNAQAIKQTYEKVRAAFIDNPERTKNAFSYLKHTDDTIEQFTFLVEYNKYLRGSDDAKVFKDILRNNIGSTTDYFNVLDPTPLMTTDFAWNAMAESAYKAEKLFNESIINGITAYRNLGLGAKKIAGDFYAMRDLLSANKLDRPKLLQQERYIKIAQKYNNLLDYIENAYNNLFNRTVAENQINYLYNILNNFPELSQKYTKTVEKLQQYWNGELELKQDPKWAIKDGKIIDEATGNTRAAIDEVTPFWEEIKQLNEDIQRIAGDSIKAEYQQAKDKAFKEAWENLKTDFKKQYTLDEADDILQQQQNFDAAFKAYVRELDPKTRLELMSNPEKAQAEREFVKQEIMEATGIDIPEIYTFDRKHITDVPYAEQAYYKPEYERILDETFNDKYATYNSMTHEYFRDAEYVKSRQLYHNDYSIAARIINRFQQVDSYEALIANRDKILTELSMFKRGNGEYEFSETLYNKIKPIFDDIIVDYSDDLKKAIEYANTKSNWIDEFNTALKAREKEFNKLTTEQRVKKTQALQRHIKNKKFTEVLQNVGRDLQATLGERNKKILKERFQPIREKIEAKLKKQFQPKFDLLNNKVTLWDPVKDQQEFRRLVRNATNDNAKYSFFNLFSLTPEEFVTELAYRRRFITFSEDDIIDKQLKAMFNKFNKTLSPENGIHLIHDANNHRYWYVLGKEKKVNMSGRQIYLDDNPIMRKQRKKQFNELSSIDMFLNDPNSPGFAKTFNELDDDFYELTGSHLGDSQGEYLKQADLENIYLQMPKEVQDVLPPLQEWTDKQFFDAYAFNESILGSVHSKQQLGMYSSDLIINMSNAITNAYAYIKPKNEYVNTVFDSMLSIASPNSVWSNFSDQDIMEGLILNPDYKLVALVDDKKYGIKTREILPTSVEAIKKAKELGAVIIPTQTYKDMYNVVNHRLGSTGFAKLWSRVIYAYKAGYLMRPGAMIRNFIDTNIKSKLVMGDEFKDYKNRAHAVLNDVNLMKTSIKNTQENLYEQAVKEYGDLAHKLFDDKDRIEKFIQRRANDGFIREDAIKKWFEEGNAKYLTYESYKELEQSFLSQGIAGNIMTDLYQNADTDLWRTFTQMTGNIVEAGNKTENYNRLAVYLYHLDHGADYTSALSKLAKTHFDYSFKTKAEQLAEMVFPFTTFSLRNYSFWVEMIEKHPWIMRNYIHLMQPHWDFSDYTPQELARDKRVQSQILNGQLKLGEFNNKVATFKANPSIQNAIQMFSDPINNVYDRLTAPIATPLEMLQGQKPNIINLIPIAGQAIQSAQTIAKTGTPLPSAIGISQKPKRTGKTIKFSNPNLSKVNAYTDDTYRTPKYRNNMVYDSYRTKGVTRYKLNMYPVVDVAHDIKMRYSTNVYNRIKNRAQTDVYKGIIYRIRLDHNKFR